MVITRVQHGIYVTANNGGFASYVGLPTVPEGGLNTINLGAIGGTSGGGAVNFASTGFVFRLADVPGVNELSGLFEEYKILSATVTFVPKSSSADMASGGVTSALHAPTAWITADTDGQFSNTSLTTLLQYGALRRVDALRPFSLTVKPRVATAVQYVVNTNTTAPQSMQRSWIAFAGNQGAQQGASIDHWGGIVAFNFENTATTGTNVGPNVQYDVFVKYRIALRRTV